MLYMEKCQAIDYFYTSVRDSDVEPMGSWWFDSETQGSWLMPVLVSPSLWIIIICIALKKVLYYLFECILLFYNYMQSIKEGVSLFICMYFTMPWFYEEHQRSCFTLYLNVYSSTMIIWRASKKGVVLFIWMYIPLLCINVL